MRTRRVQWLPVAPLMPFVATRGGVRSCLSHLPSEEIERLERRFYRAVQSGRLKATTADELSVRLAGLTPIEIWGDEYIAASPNTNDPSATQWLRGRSHPGGMNTARLLPGWVRTLLGTTGLAIPTPVPFVGRDSASGSTSLRWARVTLSAPIVAGNRRLVRPDPCWPQRGTTPQAVSKHEGSIPSVGQSPAQPTTPPACSAPTFVSCSLGTTSNLQPGHGHILSAKG